MRKLTEEEKQALKEKLKEEGLDEERSKPVQLTLSDDKKEEMKKVLAQAEHDKLEKLEAESDKETEEMFQEISEYLRRQEGIERMSMFYVIVGRYFERAADHAFQMAERAIYMKTGAKKKLGLAYKRKDSIGPH